MTRWQDTIKEHCSADVISENSIRVNNASWNPDTKEVFDDYISYDPNIKAFIVDTVKQNAKEYTIEETKTYKSIYEYLNY